MPSARPRLLVISCGGTISSVRRDGSAGAAPSMDGSALTSSVPQLAALGDVQAETFSTIPSADATLDDAVELWKRLCEWSAGLGGDPGGVVVAQGTDTLEETAFVLDALGVPVPLVFTGAMRHADLPGHDGAANLLAAAATALSRDARGMGVLVVLNDEIHLARLVRKTHTAGVAAFASPGLGPVGYLAEGMARIVLRPARLDTVAAPAAALADAPVALISASLGDDGRLLAAIAAAGYRGVVIEGFGGGHLPSPMARSGWLASLTERMPVVIASRTGSGALLHATYDFAGSETDLARRGLINAGLLDGRKARILLTLLLAASTPPEAIRSEFARLGGYGTLRPGSPRIATAAPAGVAQPGQLAP